MRQINLLPAGCHQSNQVVVYASDKKLLFASKLALYVMNPITFNIEKIISTQTRGVISLSVSPHDDNLVACSGVDGMLCVWNLSTESCILKVTHPGDILAWDPHNPNNCALIVNNPKIQLFSWDVSEANCATKRLFVGDSDTVVANVARWNPHILGQLAIGGSNGVIYLYDAQTKKSKSLKVKDRATSIVDLQWDRLSSVYMIAAYQIFISLWDTETSTEIHIFEKQNTGISSIAWLDWTAGNFLSANLKTGIVKVWNASQKQPLESIRIHSDGITSMHFASGSSRMICSGKDGSVIVYHMLKHQVEYVSSAGHTDTIFDCSISTQNPNIFSTCSYDSTIKIWNLVDLSLRKTLYGAECIVYSCSWSPNSKRIVASTISGNILIFDVETGRVLARYTYHDKASYSVKWNPNAENLILSTSADCTAAVITLDLNQLDETQIGSNRGNGAIGSRRKKTVAENQEPESIVRFYHPKGVFGCDWCTHSPNVFATACQDGIIRVWKYELISSSIPFFNLEGHTARGFSVLWSPLIPGLLASGSDDQSILVWEIPILSISSDKKNLQTSISVTPIRRLEGHTSNVRALSWNYEHRQLLLSGSWDATIRIWNVASGTLLQTISDHVADIYTITSHYQRPFTYISCSRDSTLRIWEVEGVQKLLRMKILTNGSFGNTIPSAIERSNSSDLPPGNLLTAISESIDLNLWGGYSKIIAEKFNITNLLSTSSNNSSQKLLRGAELAQSYRTLYDYFCGANGCVNLWDCVISYCLKNKSDGTEIHLSGKSAVTFSGDINQNILKNTAIPADLILNIARSNARQLESMKSGSRRGDYSGKVEEYLRLAALKYAQTGDFLKYCSLLVEIGDWTGALAMAPCVSIEFWQKLMQDYAQHLENNLSEDCVPYYLGIGKDRSAIDFYLDRNDSTSAMVVAKMSQSRTDLIPDLTTTYESSQKEINSPHNSLANWRGPRNESFRERTDTEDEKSDQLIRKVILHLVELTIKQAKPISSASHLISIGEVESAVWLLSLCGEYDLAYAISECCSLDTSNYLKQMAEAAEKNDNIDLCVNILSKLTNEEYQKELQFLLVRHVQDPALEKFQSIDKNSCLQKANEEKTIGHDDEAILLYILGQDYFNAAKLGIKRLTRHINEPFQLSPMAKKLLALLRNIRADELDDSTKNTFLSYFLWFGSHKAIQSGFWDISCGMLRILSTLAPQSEFPISENLIKYHEFCVRIQCRAGNLEDLLKEVKKLQTLANDSTIPSTEINRILHSISALLSDSLNLISSQGHDFYNPNYQRSFSQTSLYHHSVYGVLTDEIESEIRKISELLHLPILPSTLRDPQPGVFSVFKSPYGSSVLNNLEGIPSVSQGSILPVANQQLKIIKSFITNQKIQGPVVSLHDSFSYISINEAIMWKLVNPYSPLCTGQFLEY